MIDLVRIKYLQQRIAKEDDYKAYKELFEAFYHPLIRFSQLFIKSPEEAEEIVSDVFVYIWKNRGSIENISNLRVYLYVAARNTSLNYLSRQNRFVTIDLDQLPVELSTLHINPEEMLITAEMKRKIINAVEQLPARCRLIFKLVKEDQLKYREVAQVLNLSVKTIEAQMAIALKKICHAMRFDIQRSFPTGFSR